MVVVRGLRGLAIGAVAVAVIAAAPLPIMLFGAQEDTATAVPDPAPVALRANPSAPVAIDPIETASVERITKPTPAPDLSAASAEFKLALALLAEGDHAGAYGAASSFDNVVERRTIQWAAIHFGNGVIPSDSVRRYTDDAPEFAADVVFRTRLEQALVRERPSASELIETFGTERPDTIGGQIALASALLEKGETDRATEIARAVWTQNFLDPATEDRILGRFGDLLDRNAHWDRAVHLMMHDRATGVERLMKFLSPAQKTLAIARNAVSRNAKNAKKLLDTVDPSMQSHPVFHFSRAQRARQFELWDDAISWLDKAGTNPPDAAEFGFERRALTRQLLARGEVQRAYKASAGFSEGPDGRLVEAQFHAGWIALAFLKDAAAAVPHFELMAEHSTLPDSITQSHYWLGRAQAALGNDAAARVAYERAAEFGTVYYGQLARSELGMKSVELRETPDWTEAEPLFEAREVVQAIRLLANNGHKEMALPLLRGFASRLTDGAEMLLASRLAESLGSHNLAISIADTAERRGIPLDTLSFPNDVLPSTKLASTDHAAVYAVTRQESRFQIDAISSAGARGLMQLMPGTAEETAGKLGLPYSKSRLTTDAGYNALLGSTYLKAQLERFDGSLILAAAAYNAGGGNANRWIRAYGDPRDENVDPIVWIELIPLHETRTYVKRVLGNYLVYRARLGQDDLSIDTALRKIPT
jgi:soluble lytic murein transglycosylase